MAVIPEKPPKLEDWCDGSPQAPKSPSHFIQSHPICVGVWGGIAPPQGFPGGGESPHFRCSPPLWGGLNTPIGRGDF